MTKRCGYVSIIGHPNVGKSTLLNLLVGYKISAIANKPQTTRTNLRGIVTEKDFQLIITDTPGIHQRSGNALNQVLNKEAVASLEQADAVVMMIEAGRWTGEDDLVVLRLKEVTCPVFLLVNKIDTVKPKEKLLAFLQEVSTKRDFKEIFPVSATKKINTAEFLNKLVGYLPEGDFIYPEDYITDQPVKSICSELIREQLVLYLHQEIPYTTAVDIEKFEETDKLTTINATIWVGKKGQKGIVIGKKGETLKRIGSSARIALEEFLDMKVMLRLWVKVEENWQNNPRHLSELGIVSGGSPNYK
ncbi:MAG: GTPase Era [Thiotrichaceae bacterium]